MLAAPALVRAQDTGLVQRNISSFRHQDWRDHFDELGVATKYVTDRQDEPKKAFEDILWALVNSTEFIYRE